MLPHRLGKGTGDTNGNGNVDARDRTGSRAGVEQPGRIVKGVSFEKNVLHPAINLCRCSSRARASIL